MKHSLTNTLTAGLLLAFVGGKVVYDAAYFLAGVTEGVERPPSLSGRA